MIEKIYNSIIDEIVQRVPSQYADGVRQKYREYLENIYGKYDKIESEKDEKALQVFIAFERNMWINEALLYSTLIPDPALDKIRELYRIAKSAAINKIDGIEPDKEFMDNLQTNIQTLEENVDKVTEFNKLLANNLCGDAILDFNFAAGLSTNMSLGTSHIARR